MEELDMTSNSEECKSMKYHRPLLLASLMLPVMGGVCSAADDSSRIVVQVASVPGGAEVWVGGDLMGTTATRSDVLTPIKMELSTNIVMMRIAKGDANWVAATSVHVSSEPMDPITLTLEPDRPPAPIDGVHGGTVTSPGMITIPQWASEVTTDAYGKRIALGIPNGPQMRFRWCPPGTFQMGSPDTEAERWKNETLHTVSLTKGFWIAETNDLGVVDDVQWQGPCQG